MNRILHLDMDAFFAAVEVHDHPELKGKPVIIGAPPDKRGVVSTASYEARKFGVRSAMPSRTAHKLCPQGIFLPVRGERYGEVSDQVMRIIESFSPVFEPVSVDEAFIDVSGALHRWKEPVALARALKDKIREETGLTASVGVAPNKFLAKLASDLNKPDGLTVVPEDPKEIAKFLAPLPVTRIWGVGKVSAAALEKAGIRTIGDIQTSSVSSLTALVGKAWAEHVWELARGRDDRPVETGYEAKSISAETTYDKDERDAGVLRRTMIGLAEDVGRRLRASTKAARTGHIKVRFSDFRTITRQQPLSPPTSADRELIACALDLLDRQRIREPIRLLGFGVSGFEEPGAEPAQPELFEKEDESKARRARDERLDKAIDRLRERLGERSVRRGGT